MTQPKFDASAFLDSVNAPQDAAVKAVVTLKTASREKANELITETLAGIAEHPETFGVVSADTGDFLGWRGKVLPAVMSAYLDGGDPPTPAQLLSVVATWAYFKESGKFRLVSGRDCLTIARNRGLLGRGIR